MLFFLKNRLAIPATLVCLIIGFFTATQAVAALGISPGNLFLGKVLAGSTVAANINFSRGNADADVYVQVKIAGDIADHLKPLQDAKVLFPKDQDQMAFPMEFSAGNLPTGTYTGTITVAELGPVVGEKNVKNAISAGSTLRAGAQATVSVEVTNEAVEKYQINNVAIPTSEENGGIVLTFIVENQGNVDVKIGRAKVVITNVLNPNETYEEELDIGDFKIVPAFARYTQKFITKKMLKSGQYTAKVSFYDLKGAVVLQSEGIPFQVVPEGTLAQQGVLKAFKIDGAKTGYKVGEILKFIGTFENTGEVGLRPVFTIDIFKGKERVEYLKTEPQFVPVKQTADFENTFQIPEAGEYTAKAYLTFGIAKTAVKEIQFQTGELNSMLPVIFIILVILLLIIMVVVVLLLRKRNAVVASKVEQNHDQQQNNNQQGT